MFPGSTRIAILTALVGMTSLAAARLPTIQSEAQANAEPAARLPLRMGPWEGSDVPVAEDVQRALPSARILSRRYRGPAGVADVTIVSGSDATALHDPHDCLTGDGWQFVKDATRRVDVGLASGPIRIHDLLMTKGGMQARVWYWYTIGSDIYDSTLPARLALFQTRLIEGRGRRAQFVRLVVGGETESPRSTAMLSSLAHEVAAR